MSINSFKNNGNTYKIYVTPSVPDDGKAYPVIFLVHGNAGLGGQFGTEIHAFAQKLATEGYNTAVPQYYSDGAPDLDDTIPKDDILASAVDAVTALPSVDGDRIGIIGFSLGATTSMTYIAKNPKDTVAVFADFYGFLTPTIESAASNFPPTIIFHNEHDRIVDVEYSKRFVDLLTSSSIEHQFFQYDEYYLDVNHSFKPGDEADNDSQTKAINWCKRHLPPQGI